MAAPFSGNLLSYFMPLSPVGGTDCKPLSLIDLSASAGTHGEFVCVVPCVVRSAKAIVQTAVVGTTTAPTVVLSKYLNPAAGSTATVLGTITVPTGASAGKGYYKDNLSTTFAAGNVMQIKWTQAVGSAAGKVMVDWYCEIDAETFANNSNMVASST